MTEELDKNRQFPADEDPIEEALRAARVHQRAGRAKETAAVLSKVLGVDPNNIEALTGMARNCKHFRPAHRVITILCQNSQSRSRK